jgi:hypothetical protein
MKFEDGPPTGAAVAQGLSALKREGGVVLVVGPAWVGHADVCERFLGDDAERVFVRTEGSVPYDAEAAAVVERPVKTRSAGATASSGSRPDLESLRREVRSAVRGGGGGDATPRVCFYSLRPFVDGAPESELVPFLESLGRTAREAGAVVHVHLPAMVDAVPSALYGAVGVVVELHRRGESTYQQWHLPEAGETSEWVAV